LPPSPFFLWDLSCWTTLPVFRCNSVGFPLFFWRRVLFWGKRFVGLSAFPFSPRGNGPVLFPPPLFRLKWVPPFLPFPEGFVLFLVTEEERKTLRLFPLIQDDFRQEDESAPCPSPFPETEELTYDPVPQTSPSLSTWSILLLPPTTIYSFKNNKVLCFIDSIN